MFSSTHHGSGMLRTIAYPVMKTGLYVTAITSLTATSAFGMNDFSGSAILDQSRQHFPKEGYGKATMAQVVSNVSGWLLGVAVALMVLKVVLTAIDRMLMGGGTYAYGDAGGNRSDGYTLLQRIPVVGAYPPLDVSISRSSYGGGNYSDAQFHGHYGSRGYTWLDILKNFAMNLAIVLSAWIFVNMIIGLVSWFYGSANPAMTEEVVENAE